MVDNLDIVIKLLELSEGKHKSINDIELSKSLSIEKNALTEMLSNQELKDIIRSTKLVNILCPSCGKINDSNSIINGIFICDHCDCRVNQNDVIEFQHNVIHSKIESYVYDHVKSTLNTLGYDEIKGVSSEGSFSFDHCEISVKVAINSNINNYYECKGKNTTLSNYIVISLNFDKELRARTTKDILCNIFNITQLNDKDAFYRFIDHVKKDVVKYQKYLSAEREIGVESEEQYDLHEAQKNINDMLNKIYTYSKQESEEHSSRQGNAFQKYVIKLLNMAIMDTKLLGGSDICDGVGHLDREKLTWIPIEVKSFKYDEADNATYRVTKAISQLRKYSAVFRSRQISQMVDTPIFLIISYSFDENDPNEAAMINKLQSDYNIHYTFLNLEMLSRILRKSLEQELFLIDVDILYNFFNNHRYIHDKDVDELFLQIETQPDPYKGIFDTVKTKVNAYGRL